MKGRVFGAGSIGNHLTYALRQHDYDVEVIDIDDKALIRMEKEIYPSRYGVWDENIKLLKQPTNDYVDIEIIGTPPDTHTNLLVKRIENSKSKLWLVEKPFTYPSLKHIKKIEEILRNHNSSIFVGYNHSVSKAFIELLKDLKKDQVPKNIYCSWLEHWGGIFKAHPWLSGPEESYLGYQKRGGGALMEHSHGLHLLVLLFDFYSLKIKDIKSTILMDKLKNYDKKTYLQFTFENSENASFYSTDVISIETNKSISIETDDFNYKVIFGSDNGRSDTYVKKSKFDQISKKFAKTRPDDFMPEISMLNDFLKYKNKSDFIKNLSLDYGLKAASICARVFENNK